MKKALLFGLLTFAAGLTLNAQTYCEPTVVSPNWAHANSQGLHSIEIKVNGETVLTDGPETKSYNYNQNTKKFDVKRGDELTVHVTTRQWAWDIVVAFDWNIDGVFESVYRAFDDPSTPKIEKAEDFFKNTEGWGKPGNTFKVWTFTVPEDAEFGFTRMRVLVDGDGYNSGGTPPFNLCDKIGYAGSMHDYGITINAATGVKDELVKNINAYFKGNTLVVNGVVPGATVSLFDLSGNEIVKGTSNGSAFTANSVLTKGVYILRVKRGSAVSTLKLLK